MTGHCRVISQLEENRRPVHIKEAWYEFKFLLSKLLFSVIFENSNKADIFSLLQDRLNHKEKWMMPLTWHFLHVKLIGD